MSLGLHVEFTRPVSLATLLDAVPPTLGELLAIGDAPPVHVAEMRDGASYPADPQALVDTERAWTLRPVGYRECAYFGGMRLEDYDGGPESRTHIWIVSQVRRSPLEHALN